MKEGKSRGARNKQENEPILMEKIRRKEQVSRKEPRAGVNRREVVEDGNDAGFESGKRKGRRDWDFRHSRERLEDPIVRKRDKDFGAVGKGG